MHLEREAWNVEPGRQFTPRSPNARGQRSGTSVGLQHYKEGFVGERV